MLPQLDFQYARQHPGSETLLIHSHSFLTASFS